MIVHDGTRFKKRPIGNSVKYEIDVRAIPFEKVVEGVSDAPKKKMPRGGMGIGPISLRGGLPKCPKSLRGGITTGPLYYCGVVSFPTTQVL